MLRLTCIQRPERRIVVEGNLSGPYVEELRALAARFLEQGGAWTVDLSGLGFADPNGVALLAELEAAGVELAEGSAFLTELLRQTRTRASNAAPGASDWERERAWIAALRGPAAARAEAEEALLRQFGPELLAFAERLLRSRAEACAALQAGFTAALEALMDAPDVLRLGPWLRRFVAREALHRLDEVREVPAGFLSTHLPHFTEAGTRILDEADESFAAGGPLAALEECPPAFAARVRAAVDQLVDALRAPFLLCDVEGFGLAETAGLLEQPQPEIKRRLHHARQALRFLLGRALATREELARA